MNTRLAFALALTTAVGLAAEADEIGPGDTLYLYASISGCDQGKQVIGSGVVTRSGAAVMATMPIFGMKVPAAGRSAAEVAASLAEEVHKRIGHRPRSFEIAVVPAGDYRADEAHARGFREERGPECRLPEPPRRGGGQEPHNPYDLPAELPDYRFAQATPAPTKQT